MNKDANCLFCKMVDKQIPAEIVAEDDNILVIKDINPQAPSHLLLIPKTHIETLNDTDKTHQAILGQSILKATEIAKELGIQDSGYRLVYNVNRGAGQSVFHIHLHLLGGRLMNWPPG